jgi:hypothetical protein
MVLISNFIEPDGNCSDQDHTQTFCRFRAQKCRKNSTISQVFS